MIYFIRGTQSGRVKIGYTGGKPKNRLRALQTGNPEPLELVAAVEGEKADEKRLHTLLAADRLRVLRLVERLAVMRMGSGCRLWGLSGLR